MLNAKKIKTVLSGVLLVLSLITFSGFTGVSAPLEIPKTELVTKTNSDNLSVHYSKYLKTIPVKVHFNQYTVFSFKYFLIKHHFDFNITLKSQKNEVLEFTNYNSVLEQNLIAKTNTETPDYIFIK